MTYWKNQKSELSVSLKCVVHYEKAISFFPAGGVYIH